MSSSFYRIKKKMLFIAIAFFTTAVSAAAFLKYSIKIVPANATAIMQQWGKFEKVLGPGAYMMMPLRDSFRGVQWSYPEEGIQTGRAPRDGTTGPIVRRFVRTNIFDMGDQRLDVVPCQGITSDSVTVSVNGTLNYRIVDPMKAVYEVNDPLAFMVDSVFASVRKVVSECTHIDMIGSDASVAEAIIKQVNDRMENYGITCTQFLVQGIDMNEEIKNSYERAIVTERSRETELARHLAELNFNKEKEKADADREEQRAQIEANRKVQIMRRESVLAETKAKQELTLLETATRKRLATMDSESQQNVKRQRVEREQQEAEMMNDAEMKKLAADHNMSLAVAKHKAAELEQANKQTLQEDAEKARIALLDLQTERDRKEFEMHKARSMSELETQQQRMRIESENAEAMSRAEFAGQRAFVECLSSAQSEHVSSAMVQIMTAKDMGAALGNTSKMILPTDMFKNSPFGSMLIGGLRRFEQSLCEDDVDTNAQ